MSLKDVLAAIGKCSEAIEGHGKALGELGDRVGKLEAGPAADADGDPDDAPMQPVVDSRKRADAVTAEQRHDLATAQLRADHVAMAFGERASAPLVGEDLTAFRVRLLLPYQPHSAAFKDLDLDKLAAAGGLDVAEKQIYADAMAYSKSPERVAPGQLLMTEKTLDGGHVYRKFSGQPRAWMDEIAGSVRQYAVGGLLAGEGLLNNN